MTAFATQKNIQTTGTSVLPIGADGAGRSKLMTSAEIRSAASVYSQATMDAAFSSLSSTYYPLSGNPSGFLSSIADGSITNSMIAGSIAVSKLSITGTPDGTKFLRDDGSWQASGGGGSPGGSPGQMQFNSAGAFGGAAALTYSASGTLFTVTGQTSTDVLACLKSAASATGNFFECRNSANAKMLEVTIDGEILQSTGDLLIAGAGSGLSGVAVRQNGFTYIRLQPLTGILISSSRLFGWTSNGFNINTSADTALARNAAGVVEINNGTAGTFRDIIVRNLRMASPTLVPASASATGAAGQIAWDADYIYVCTTTNAWKRVAIATW